MDSTFHLRHEPLIIPCLQHLLNALRADGVPIHMSEIALIVSKATRQTVWLVLDVVIFCLYISERTVNHTTSRPPNCDVSIFISITAKSTIRIKNGRVFEMFPIKRPIPVDQLSREVTLPTQGRLVDVQEITVPGEEGRRVVCVIPDVAVDPGEVFV